LNQLIATLLGLLSINIFPIAAKAEPIRQNVESPSFKSNLNQAPPITKIPPAINPIFILYLLSIQLQGNANRGCAIVNKSPFKVTYNDVKWNISSTMTLILENVCTGNELTSAAIRYVVNITNLYGYS